MRLQRRLVIVATGVAILTAAGAAIALGGPKVSQESRSSTRTRCWSGTRSSSTR